MKRRSFLAAISCLPFLGWVKPEPEYLMRPKDWRAGYMRVVADPRLIDSNDYYFVTGARGPTVLVVREDQVETARAIVRSYE